MNLTVRKHRPVVVALFCIASLSYFNVRAQQPKSDPASRIIPPSPNASAFAKYGNLPVSTYTGVPNIEIPLYTISIRDIKVPISLSYHASGIKVGEESSRVGLGWVLNAGGVISRNIINRDDLQDLPDAFFGSQNLSPAIPQGPNKPPSEYVQTLSTYHYMDTQLGLQSLNLFDFLLPTGFDPLFRPHDFEPDQYNYNFLGHAGKFVLNRNWEVILEKQEKIRIKFVPVADRYTIEVTTPDGFVYKFDAQEMVLDTYNTGGYVQQSSWYLSEIISPSNEIVKFHYSSLGAQYIIPVGSYIERWVFPVYSCLGQPFCMNPPSLVARVPGKNYSNLALDEITWDLGKVKFNYADDRLDIDGDKRLTSIQIFEKDAESPHEEILFHQDYFTSPPANPVSPNEFPTEKPDQAVKRMKLDGITKRALPVSDLQPEEYSFEYNEEAFIPGKNSFARDHWGYYNGRNNNTSLIPTFTRVITGSPLLSSYIGSMGPQKDPAADHMQLFSLKSIKYPTRGLTKFYYTPNDYDLSASGGGNDNSEPETYPETLPFLYTEPKGTLQVTPLDLTDEYVDEEGNTVPVIVRGGFRTNMSITCSQLQGTPNVYFEIVDDQGLLKDRISVNGVRCNTPGQLSCLTCGEGQGENWNNGQGYFFDYTANLDLSPGKYYWKAFMETTETQIVDISAQITYAVDASKKQKVSEDENGVKIMYAMGGGLRISKIEDFDPVTGVTTNVRKYDYHYLADQDEDSVMEWHSYGRRMVKPAYSYFDVGWQRNESQVPGVPTPTACFSCISLVRDSGHPQANYEKSPVAYDKVIEYVGVQGENGRTEYEFENLEETVRQYFYPYTDFFPAVEVPGSIPIQPPHSNTIANAGNGNLLKQTHFTADGKQVLMTENSYSSKFRNIVYGLSPSEIRGSEQLSGGVYDGQAIITDMGLIMVLYETMDSDFSFLSETKATSYDLQGIETTKTSTKYFYDNAEHLQLTRTVSEESNGHKTVTVNKYPADYTPGESNAVITEMKGEKFMHGLPIESTVLDETPSGTQSIKHRELNVFGNFNSLILPKEKFVLKNTRLLTNGEASSYIPATPPSETLYTKLYTTDYSVDGNLTKVRKPFDIPVSFIWGYDENLPIAEVKNAEPADVFVTSFEEDGDVFENSSAESLAKTGSKVHSNSTFQFPAGYTPVESNTLISYWYFQNDEWKFSGVIPFQRTINSAGTKLDEVRAFPKGSLVSTYTYHPAWGTTSVTDANNITTYYEYDGLGRLKLIRDDKQNIVKHYKYHFADAE